MPFVISRICFHIEGMHFSYCKVFVQIFSGCPTSCVWESRNGKEAMWNFRASLTTSVFLNTRRFVTSPILCGLSSIRPVANHVRYSLFSYTQDLQKDCLVNFNPIVSNSEKVMEVQIAIIPGVLR